MIIKNIYFLRRHIWKNLVYIVAFLLQFSRVTGHWKFSNKAPAPIWLCIGLVEAVLRPKILGGRLVIPTKILIIMDYYWFCIYISNYL